MAGLAPAASLHTRRRASIWRIRMRFWGQSEAVCAPLQLFSSAPGLTHTHATTDNLTCQLVPRTPCAAAVVCEAGSAPRYSKPPPPYPPLCGVKAKELGITHNLMESFVAMDIKPVPVSVAEEEGPAPVAEVRSVGFPDHSGAGKAANASASVVQYGQVMDVAGFVRWLSRESDQDLGY